LIVGHEQRRHALLFVHLRWERSEWGGVSRRDHAREARLPPARGLKRDGLAAQYPTYLILRRGGVFW
jgi:hypothetical protein